VTPLEPDWPTSSALDIETSLTILLHGAIEVALQGVRAQLLGQPAATLSRGAVG
jgi:hypothetical protein